MQTSDNFNYGTILSYATPQFDNAFTVTDYTGSVIFVNYTTFFVLFILTNVDVVQYMFFTFFKVRANFIM